MAFHVRDDFRAGGPVSQVPAGWYNSVAKFLNNLVGGFGVRIHKEQADKPIVELDPEKIKDLVLTTTPPVVGTITEQQRAAFAPKSVKPFVPDADETTADKLARVGNSSVAAPYDHVHKLAPPDAPTEFQNPQPTSGVSNNGNSTRNTSYFTTAGNGDALKIKVLSRMDVTTGGVAMMFFREWTITADGRIYKIGPEDAGVEVVQ